MFLTLKHKRPYSTPPSLPSRSLACIPSQSNPGDFVISSFVFTCFHDSVCPAIRPSVQSSSASDPRLSGLSVRSRVWWLRQQQQQQLFHGIRSRRAMLSRRSAHSLFLSLSGMSANGSSEYLLVCWSKRSEYILSDLKTCQYFEDNKRRTKAKTSTLQAKRGIKSGYIENKL